jgi:hypothetical protein
VKTPPNTGSNRKNAHPIKPPKTHPKNPYPKPHVQPKRVQRRPPGPIRDQPPARDPKPPSGPETREHPTSELRLLPPGPDRFARLPPPRPPTETQQTTAGPTGQAIHEAPRA